MMREKASGARWRAWAALCAAAVAAGSLATTAVRTAPAVAGPVVTGSWTDAPPPTFLPHKEAALLSDGRVLGMGGNRDVCRPACFELYDPQIGAWQPLPPVPPLNNGDVFRGPEAYIYPLTDARAYVRFPHFFSDVNNASFLLDTKDLVSPWTSVNDTSGSLRSENLTVTVLNPPFCQGASPPAGYPCGKVLISGGNNKTDDAIGKWTSDLLDPDAEPPTITSLRQPAMGIPLDGKQGTIPVRIPDHEWSDYNGYCPGRGEPPGTMEQTDPCQLRGGIFRRSSPVVLDDGRVFVAGAELSTRQQSNFYDPITNTWSPAAPMPHGVGDTSGGDDPAYFAVRLRDGRVLVAGRNADNEAMPLVFDPTLDPPMGRWTTIQQCPYGEPLPGYPKLRPHCDETFAMLEDGTVLVVGGAEWGTLTALFDPEGVERGSDNPATSPWTPLDNPTIFPTYDAMLLTGERCGNQCGNVLVTGFAGAQIYQFLKIDGLDTPGGPTCGGTEVTISGSGFKRATAVNFGAVSVPKEGFTVNADGTTITVRTPRNVAGPVPVTVSQNTTTAAKPGLSFNYFRPDPAVVSSLNPREGPAKGGEKVDIGGSFPAECVRKVRFGDNEAALAGPATPGALTATSPEGTAGQQVRVSVDIDQGLPAPEGTLVPSTPENLGDDVYTYLALPAISSVTPPRGPAFGGTSVTITGTGLEGASEVRFGAAKVPPSKFTVNSAGTSLSATLPGHDPGAFPVTLTTPKRGDSLASAAPQFTYHPGISGLFPPSGPLTGGTQVTIAGRGFTGAQAVRFGAASVVPISLTDTEIVLKTPPHGLPEAVPVSLTASGLNSLPENVLFNYGLADVVDPDPTGDPDPGPPRQDSAPPEPAPPGGSPAASPSNAPSPSASPTPGAAPAPGAVPAPGQAPVPGQAPLSAQVPGQSASPSNSPAALPPPIPVASPVAAPGTAVGQSGPGANQGVAGAGEDDEGQGAHRYAMSDARTTLALGAAGATGCFTFLAAVRRQPARRRRRSGAGRPQPKGAY